jgi:hypothetical protein
MLPLNNTTTLPSYVVTLSEGIYYIKPQITGCTEEIYSYQIPEKDMKEMLVTIGLSGIKSIPHEWLTPYRWKKQ